MGVQRPHVSPGLPFSGKNMRSLRYPVSEIWGPDAKGRRRLELTTNSEVAFSAITNSFLPSREDSKSTGWKDAAPDLMWTPSLGFSLHSCVVSHRWCGICCFPNLASILMPKSSTSAFLCELYLICFPSQQFQGADPTFHPPRRRVWSNQV